MVKIDNQRIVNYGFIAIIAIFLFKLLNVDLNISFGLGTQSIIGTILGGGVTLALLLFIVGLFLILIPEPTTSVVGAVMAVIGLVIGFDIIVSFISNIFGSFSSPILMGALVFMGFIFFRSVIK